MKADNVSDVFRRSLERERAARKAAETLLECKSLELYNINQNLRMLNSSLEESETRYRKLVELIPDAIWVENNGLIVFMNAAALRLFGAHSAEQLLQTPLLDHVAEENRSLLGETVYRESDGANARPHLVLKLKKLDGSLVDVEMFGCPIQFNNLASVMNVAHDITERRQYEMAIKHQATHDILTGLPNRALFIDRLSHAVRRAERHNSRLAVLFVDLDKFKVINDTLGHDAGDQLLKTVAERIRRSVRDSDTVARLGGDEFVLLLDEPWSDNTPHLIVQRIVGQLAIPVKLLEQDHIITSSIGISIYPDDGNDAATLLQHADIAMYRAKELGRNKYQFFTRELQNRLDTRANLEQNLRLALERGEFVLHYQPQVAFRNGDIVGLEALIRWNSPELGLVTPLQFIPAAEESHLILAIGEWVIRAVCAHLKDWKDSGIQIVPVAINIAAPQFTHQEIDRLVSAELQAAHLETRYLELELTESLSMHDPETSIALMTRLKDIGITMAIDDFGTGFSNLSYLKRFPINKLKIDESFVKGMTENAEDRAITAAVIQLAHSLGLRAVGEGVETEGQLRQLAMQGCDAMQGYYFCPPLPAAEMTDMLRKRPRLDVSRLHQRNPRQTVLLIDDELDVLASFRRLLHNHACELITVQNQSEAYEVMACHEVSVVIADHQLIRGTGLEFLERVKQLYPRSVRILLTAYGCTSLLADAVNKGAIFKFISKPWDNVDVIQILNTALTHYDNTEYR